MWSASRCCVAAKSDSRCVACWIVRRVFSFTWGRPTYTQEPRVSHFFWCVGINLSFTTFIWSDGELTHANYFCQMSTRTVIEQNNPLRQNNPFLNKTNKQKRMTNLYLALNLHSSVSYVLKGEYSHIWRVALYQYQNQQREQSSHIYASLWNRKITSKHFISKDDSYWGLFLSDFFWLIPGFILTTKHGWHFRLFVGWGGLFFQKRRNLLQNTFELVKLRSYI